MHEPYIERDSGAVYCHFCCRRNTHMKYLLSLVLFFQQKAARRPPWMAMESLTLAELRSTASALQTRLLAFLHAAVAAEESGPLQFAAVLGVDGE